MIAGLRRTMTVLALSAHLSCGGSLDSTAGVDASAPDAPPQLHDGKPGQIASASQRCATAEVGPPLLRRLTRRQIDNTLRDIFPAAGDAWSGFSLPDLSSPLGFSNDAAVLVVSPQTAREYLQSIEQLADIVTGDAHLAATLPCAESGQASDCSAELVDRYAGRLFRRGLHDDERGRYQALFASIASASNVRSAAKWTLVALMQSPHMLYRRELGTGAPAGALTADEIATELAYTYSDSPPSAELLERAARGELDAPEARVAEARRLLASERGHAVLRQFFREWLHYDAITSADRPGIGGFAEARPRMLEESARFVDAVLFERAGDVRELLTASYTFADRTLAEYYALPDAGDAFAMIERPTGRGVGILAQGAVLASGANLEASSPTRRGLLVQERLLCRPRPSPPANVPPLGDSAAAGVRTTRERYEKAHAQAGCATCHSQFDPLGFAFEHFDQGGRYRADEAGAAIDASGRVINMAGETLEFDSQEELAVQLAGQPEVVDCISGLMAAYAFGGGGGEPCLAEQARAELAAGRYGLLEFMAQLAASSHFARRDDRSASSATTSGEPSSPAAIDAGVASAADAAVDADASPVQEPAMPDPAPSPAITAQYAASNAMPDDNVIGPTLQLTNASATDPVDLGSIELRYYFSNERAGRCPDGCKVESYYAGRHPSGANVTAERSYVQGVGTDAYLSITFLAGTPVLLPGEAIEMQQQFHTEPYETFDENDDYSFDPTKTSLTDSSKVTVYRSGELVWGTPP